MREKIGENKREKEEKTLLFLLLLLLRLLSSHFHPCCLSSDTHTFVDEISHLYSQVLFIMHDLVRFAFLLLIALLVLLSKWLRRDAIRLLILVSQVSFNAVVSWQKRSIGRKDRWSTGTLSNYACSERADYVIVRFPYRSHARHRIHLDLRGMSNTKSEHPE